MYSFIHRLRCLMGQGNWGKLAKAETVPQREGRVGRSRRGGGVEVGCASPMIDMLRPYQGTPRQAARALDLSEVLD